MELICSRLKCISRLLLLSGLLFGSVVSAEDSVIDNIKSVYIYNFLSFIQWPEYSRPVDEYRLCVVAEKGLIEKLTAVVQNEQMNGRSFVIVPYDLLSEATDCHLIYLQNSALNESDSLVDFDQPGALLIGDAAGFVSEGLGMVGFETRGRKVRVAMNLTRLQEAGFKVSSKLLRIVRIER